MIVKETVEEFEARCLFCGDIVKVWRSKQHYDDDDSKVPCELISLNAFDRYVEWLKK